MMLWRHYRMSHLVPLARLAEKKIEQVACQMTLWKLALQTGVSVRLLRRSMDRLNLRAESRPPRLSLHSIQSHWERPSPATRRKNSRDLIDGRRKRKKGCMYLDRVRDE